MWFKLNTTFNTHLGSLSDLTGSWSVTKVLTYFTTDSTQSMVTKGEAYEAVFTMVAGSTYKGFSITMGGTDISSSGTWDASAGTVTVRIASVTGSVVITCTAEGSTSGGEEETPDGTATYNDVSYWVRQSISSTGVIETPETAGYTRSNIMAINKFTKAITLKGTSEGMYFAKVTYDADGNFLARSSWDTPAVGVAVTYFDTNPFNVVIATKAETNYDLAKMVSIIDVRDA